MGAYAGVDWAKDEHVVRVSDERGEPLAERVFAHDEEGICALCVLLGDHGVERVAVERPDGLLVERLLDAGLTVLALHPNQVKAARVALANQLRAELERFWPGATRLFADTAARLLAEIGDCRLRYATSEALAADGGMSAVAVESGKRKTAAFRYDPTRHHALQRRITNKG